MLLASAVFDLCLFAGMQWNMVALELLAWPRYLGGAGARTDSLLKPSFSGTV
jgi:hypothetical protein